MKKGIVVGIALMVAVGFSIVLAGASADAQYKGTSARKAVEKAVNVETCYGCHDPIKMLHTMGKHEKVNCVNCHSGLAKHLENPGTDTRPVTDTSWESCGKCHKDQYEIGRASCRERV